MPQNQRAGAAVQMPTPLASSMLAVKLDDRHDGGSIVILSPSLIFTKCLMHVGRLSLQTQAGSTHFKHSTL